ncbi:MAG: cation:proton antiporter [Lachnospiraceae bacterium]|nr:cation:proton antiporter [Lachnospiraceae bacterium]
MSELLAIAVSLGAGLLLTRALKPLKLPDVTAYLIAGLLLGPILLGRFGITGLGFHSFEELDALGFISDVALGFIAFSIGSEFSLSSLRRLGKQAVIIGVVQAVLATLLVDVALLLFHFLFPDILSVPAAITLGAIASATAPAATLMVVRQYKAKGEVTSLLLPIVALDDAVGLILFAVSFGIARAMISGTPDLFSVLVNPLLEIVLSLLLGALAGLCLTQLEKLFHSNTNRLSMTITFILLTVALSMLRFEIGPVTVGFSPLLVCMMLGTLFVNICPLSDEIMERANKWSSPLMVLFFVVSGADLDLSVFGNGLIVVIGVVYILVRCAGKYFGASLSARALRCSPNVVRYLGITLFPQAGVALGMCVTAQQLPGDGPLIRSIVLFAVLVYEIAGPLLTKWALTRSGDIAPQPEEVRNRREAKLKAAREKQISGAQTARKN